MNKFISILLVTLFLGCSYSQATYNEYETLFLLNSSYSPSIKSGKVEVVDTIENNIKYHLIFDQVIGGDSKLFGKWVVTEGDGEKVKRLIISENSKTVASFSIEDFKSFGYGIIDLNHYINPKDN